MKNGLFCIRRAVLMLAATLAVSLLNGCYLFDFFGDKKKKSQDDTTLAGVVLGTPLGQRASGINEAALAGVYAVTTDKAPAPIRPDPDVYIRRLLRQYRPEGSVVARQIGSVEQFRLLLGGASEDFAKTPQESYDATSLLAAYNVAEDVCRGLVAPNPWEHPGWETILPAAASDTDTNIRFLAQRFIGKPSANIAESTISALSNIMSIEAEAMDQDQVRYQPYVIYVPVCATLALDAEALFL